MTGAFLVVAFSAFSLDESDYVIGGMVGCMAHYTSIEITFLKLLDSFTTGEA
ncbi:MAG: hypothetical protein WAM14_14875 [Candidatus Nitrosopolaris sp.]